MIGNGSLFVLTQKTILVVDSFLWTEAKYERTFLTHFYKICFPKLNEKEDKISILCRKKCVLLPKFKFKKCVQFHFKNNFYVNWVDYDKHNIYSCFSNSRQIYDLKMTSQTQTWKQWTFLQWWMSIKFRYWLGGFRVNKLGNYC